MQRFSPGLIFPLLLVAGCHATRDVAVTSYHVTRGLAVGSYRVATAPVHYALRKRGDASEAVTTETLSSDAAIGSQSVPASQVPLTRKPMRQESVEQIPTSSPRVARKDAAQSKTKKTQTSGSEPARSTQPEFPMAKAVPGKPGYVVSPFDSSGRYVDVSGYASGTKVKDPWTDKIFIVP